MTILYRSKQKNPVKNTGIGRKCYYVPPIAGATPLAYFSLGLLLDAQYTERASGKAHC